jgi:anti-sigma regulatory factor (Ser/Thr protein kinase)
MPYRQKLPRTIEAPAQARRLLVDWVGDEMEPHELEKAKLVVSELVTNAVVHGQGKIEFQVDLGEHSLLIEVIDEGKGFEHEARQSRFEDLSGRGLAIVDAETSRWGIHEGTTHVWAELERTHVWVQLERPGPRLGEDAKPDEPDELDQRG